MHEEPTFVDSQKKKIQDKANFNHTKKPVADSLLRAMPTNQMFTIQHDIELEKGYYKQLI